MIVDPVVVFRVEAIGLAEFDFGADVVHPFPPLEIAVAVKRENDPERGELPRLGKERSAFIAWKAGKLIETAILVHGKILFKPEWMRSWKAR